MNKKAQARILLIYLNLLFSFLLFTCNDSENNNNPSSMPFDCDYICEKRKECTDSSDKEVEDCKTICKGMAEYYQKTYISATNICYRKPCSEIYSCIESSIEECKTPDFSPYLEAGCEKMVECQYENSKEECISNRQQEIQEQLKKKTTFQDVLLTQRLIVLLPVLRRRNPVNIYTLI